MSESKRKSPISGKAIKAKKVKPITMDRVKEFVRKVVENMKEEKREGSGPFKAKKAIRFPEDF